MQGTASSLLLKRREALKLTQYEVARRADVRESDISRWERGVVKSPPLTGMRKVCRVLGIDLEELADALLADEARSQEDGAAGQVPANPNTVERFSGRAGRGVSKGRKPRESPPRPA